jgi:hypothetical protein
MADRRDREASASLKRLQLQARRLMRSDLAPARQRGSDGLDAGVAPAWLDLTIDERRDAANEIARVVGEFEPASFRELVWCFAAEKLRAGSRKPGRPAKWTAADGYWLVCNVQEELAEHAKNCSDSKAVRQAIARLLKERPGRYAKFSEARLRVAFYEALPRASAMMEWFGAALGVPNDVVQRELEVIMPRRRRGASTKIQVN